MLQTIIDTYLSNFLFKKFNSPYLHINSSKIGDIKTPNIIINTEFCIFPEDSSGNILENNSVGIISIIHLQMQILNSI
ncbi:MAG: hypothetical protein NC096_02105 [Candidatus Amulumruptor caecigallinarius]|nr:hypothetical protein [Candidatus Amulumruptor caecigallinarius]